ncbi:uncharacterized protein BDR25DRAFT_310754 [Lindgomyces ingoldianus]|uniref:Uncharacterized protein n=1 Tax=Lindgomyces ingoldianus TaxID=673940 RepID=A0ACB6RA13_9PLEO|nr:uncharacterized protein BDR25DRAFT_310754 [Lindgomyces ingoldianus]KAF2475362.1 hypothetical protein BDR25DRAFT_310754 [Lindgomyces ingoldianus]
MLTTPPPPKAIWGTVIVLLVLDIIAVILRFAARRRLKQKLQLDDWLTATSLLLVFGCASIMLYGLATKTLGYPTPVASELQTRSALDASNWTIETSRKLEYSFLCIVAPLLGAIKLSVLFFYRRLFVVDKHYKNSRNIITVAMITIIALWATGSCFVFMFMCGVHFEAIYSSVDDVATEGMCINGLDVGYAFAIGDFVTDAITILIPIPFVWKLHLSWGRKIAVMGVFLLGILQIGYDPSFDEEPNPNLPKVLLTNEVYYLTLEATIAIIACCLPTLRSLFTQRSVDSVVRGVRSLFSLRSGSFPSSRSDDDSQLAQHNETSYDKMSNSAKEGLSVSGGSVASNRPWTGI